ncbi:MAG: alpha-glucan family phosphorylase [Gammaproteobacteria bacterium]|nr:alpha-glucan family phosphorylase [Gammaproteobacteria bacterium]
MQIRFTQEPRVAYFSMEIALHPDIPTYSGGLGILAGDTMRTAADLELPMVAVSLVSRAGYFRQTIDADGHQVEHPEPWDPARAASPLDAKITVPIEGRQVWVGGWLYELAGSRGGIQPVVLLDTDLNENTAADREITHTLYGGDAAYRLKQEIVLGIGGVRLLRAFGFRVRHYHMNEGHSALLTLELLRQSAYAPEAIRPGEPSYDIPRVRKLCNFTTHTPVDAGHDKFSYDLVNRLLGGYLDIGLVKSFAGNDVLNMTRLALSLSEYVNGVAQRHAEISRQMFPGYGVRAITNGVHPLTWTHPSFVKLFDTHVPGWCHEPELLVRASRIPDEALWQAHTEAKRDLIAQVRARSGVTLDPQLPILGFARRMTGYKRPDLLFTDIARLKRIAELQPFQIILAGKAHPHDDGGRQLIERLHADIRALAGIVPAVFLPNYEMTLAQSIVAGVDVWLNTPQCPLEASGTSGMKAAINGVPSLSVLDGWWIEGCLEGVTGWAVGDGNSRNGDDGQSLYDKLERTVLPLYGDVTRAAWIAVMKGAICKNASYFNSHRMMRRYVTEAYLR